MKQKFGTILEANLIKELKKRAVEEDRSLTEVVQDALVRYLHQSPGKNEALDAWQRLNGAPVRVTDEDFQAVLELDMWEQ